MPKMNMGKMDDMQHASKVYHVDAWKAQKDMNKGLQERPFDPKGNPMKAFDYEY